MPPQGAQVQAIEWQESHHEMIKQVSLQAVMKKPFLIYNPMLKAVIPPTKPDQNEDIENPLLFSGRFRAVFLT